MLVELFKRIFQFISDFFLALSDLFDTELEDEKPDLSNFTLGIDLSNDSDYGVVCLVEHKLEDGSFHILDVSELRRI